MFVLNSHIDGLASDYGNYIANANALELPQSCAEPLICLYLYSDMIILSHNMYLDHCYASVW